MVVLHVMVANAILSGLCSPSEPTRILSAPLATLALFMNSILLCPNSGQKALDSHGQCRVGGNHHGSGDLAQQSAGISSASPVPKVGDSKNRKE